ncbi:MAG: glycosyltransferase family 39 protein [Lacipirellulaceae bacterium]
MRDNPDAGHEAPRDTPGRFWTLLLLIAVIATGWRCVRLFEPAFDHDEAYEVLHATTDLGELVARHDGFPPLYRWLVSHAIAASGSGQATRWFSVLSGVLAVVVTGLVGRRLAGPTPGLFAAALLAFSANHVLLSQHGRGYAFYVLLVAVMLAFAWRLRRSDAWFDWVGFVAAAWLTIATHYFGGVPVLILGIAILVEKRGRGLPGALVAAAALTAAGTLLIPSLRADFADSGEYFHNVEFDREALAFSYLWLLTGNTFGPSVTELRELGGGAGARSMAPWAIAIFAPAIVLAVAGWRRMARGDRAWLALLLALPPLAAALAANVTVTGYNYRYVVWMVVPMCLWLGAGAALDRRRWVTTAATIALVVLGVFATQNRWANARYAEHDFYSVARRIEAESDPADLPPAVLATPTYYGEGVLYSLPTSWPAATLSAHPAADQDWDAVLGGFAGRIGQRREVWLVAQWFPENHAQRKVVERLVHDLDAELVARVSSTVMVYRAPAAALTARRRPATPASVSP